MYESNKQYLQRNTSTSTSHLQMDSGRATKDPCPFKFAPIQRYPPNMNHSLLSYRTTDYQAAQTSLDDDTNPLFISAVRIFLEYVRDKHGISCPEKCTLDQLIMFLGEFQETAKTKKGERYSPSTIRVIRYSLNRVIALGKNQQEMRPYPTQNAAGRKRKKTDETRSNLTASMLPTRCNSDEVQLLRQSPPRFFGCLPYTGANNEIDPFPVREKAHLPQPNQAMNQLNQSTTVNNPYPEKHSDFDIFRRWLAKQRIQPTFEIFSLLKLCEYITMFFRSNANNVTTDGDFRRSLGVFHIAISSYLRRNGVDFETEAMFEPARDAYRMAMRIPSEQKCEPAKRRKIQKTVKNAETSKSLHIGTEWLEIPLEFIKSLYRTGTLSCSSAVALQRKVWFELTMFFRDIPCCPDQIFWNKGTFKVSMGEHNVRYIALNPEMYNRYGSAMERGGQEGRIMVERKGSPLCPVASFEMYMSCLDPGGDVLFPQILLNTSTADSKSLTPSVARNNILYAKKPLSSEILSEMMASIGNAGRIPFRFSNRSVAETDHLQWMRAVTAVELERSCSADSPVRTSHIPEETASPFVRCSVINGRSVEASSPRQSVIQSARKTSYGSSSISDTGFSTSPRSSPHSDQSSCSSADRDDRPDVGSRSPTEEIWNKKTKLLRYVQDTKDDCKEDVKETSITLTPINPKDMAPGDFVRHCLDKWCQGRHVDPLTAHSKEGLDAVLHALIVQNMEEGSYTRDELLKFRSGLHVVLSSPSNAGDDLTASHIPKTCSLLQSLLRDPKEAAANSRTFNRSTNVEGRSSSDLINKGQMTVKSEPVDDHDWMVPTGFPSPSREQSVDDDETDSDVMIIVRPQICIINTGVSRDLCQIDLKQRIRAAVQRAVHSVEWDSAIDDAVQTARSDVNKMPARDKKHVFRDRQSELLTEDSKFESPKAFRHEAEPGEFIEQLSKEMMEEVYQDVCCSSPVAMNKTKPMANRAEPIIRKRSASLSAP